VGKNDALGKFMKPYKRNKSLERIGLAFYSKLLLININSFLLVAAKNAFILPLFCNFSGLFIGLLSAGKLETDKVVLVFRKKSLSLLIVNNIVRGTNESGDLACVFGKSHSLKGFNNSHNLVFSS
jgi:hypothetical protein